MLGSIFSDPYDKSCKSSSVSGTFPYPAADRRKPDLSSCVGGSVGLPSIWVLVAVTLGGSLMGIAGMLIFIPTVSVIYTLFREWVYARLEKKQLVL